VTQTTTRATISTGTQSVIFPSRLAIPEHDSRRQGPLTIMRAIVAGLRVGVFSADGDGGSPEMAGARNQ
jgi:hypothetical protein